MVISPPHFEHNTFHVYSSAVKLCTPTNFEAVFQFPSLSKFGWYIFLPRNLQSESEVAASLLSWLCQHSIGLWTFILLHL